MSDRAGLSRGDRNRNLRLARMRQLLPPENAIVGIDLADSKQAAVVTDHDSRVIARRRVTAQAWQLGELLDWAFGRAKAAGFASATVACEPAGHRWRVLAQLAARRGLALVCVRPLLVYRAREGEDLTVDKSDPKDAVIIARLSAADRCAGGLASETFCTHVLSSSYSKPAAERELGTDNKRDDAAARSQLARSYGHRFCRRLGVQNLERSRRRDLSSSLCLT